ncbi:hypothetical protein [Streptomyces alanosinicus]|uniref:DUF4355 domain-containing protein n=1 Tax=Streptomyces alanosinicus TaxID=68171 RepID=A0A918YP55_9ACTN|nr:hypothetical protein [Streptomyces alanosinicus]GHE11391.1 hypothetical protein GCM10010339_71020 [Streptomyces alanosinicus]
MRTRSLPAPTAVLGYRRDGRPIHPVLGASPDDDSNSDEATLSISQKHLSTLMAREKDQGGRAAVRGLVEKLGFPSASALEEFITTVRKAEQEQLTEAERREQALAEREKAALGRENAAIAREREVMCRALLARAGATGRDLDDAVVLLRVADDADETAFDEAIQELKGRRPELFAHPSHPLPAAPGGAPASVPPPRPGNVERKPGAAGLEMARRRGLLTNPG